ncbi:MAG: hypothetical protein ACOY3I_09595 [Verrucomicrobiota bacterium]
MFEHPQLAELRQRKWNLVARSASLRDDLMIEAVALEKWSTWMEAGWQLVLLSGKKFNWTWGLFGMTSVWMYKKLFNRKGDAPSLQNPIIQNVLGITQKVIAGWRLFQTVKELWNSRGRKRPLELE